MRRAIICALALGAAADFLHREEVSPRHHTKTLSDKDKAKIQQIEARLRVAEKEVKALESREAALAKKPFVPAAQAALAKKPFVPAAKVQNKKASLAGIKTPVKANATAPVVEKKEAKVEKKVASEALATAPKVKVEEKDAVKALASAPVVENAKPKVEEKGALKAPVPATIVATAKAKVEEKVALKAPVTAPVVETAKAKGEEKVALKALAVSPVVETAKAKVEEKVALKAVAASPKQEVVKAAIAVVSSHNDTGVVHEHAVSAQASAQEAQHHLQEALKAYNKTKTNIKDIVATGRKIEATAADIKTIYTPSAPKKADEKKSGSRGLAAPAFALFVAVAARAFVGVAC